ncbi:MAG: DUF72 domain-containing protein [Chloroflexi bacterium]|nr:DUF72 domain-containing protein [Chloroflexota bacterium]MCI0577249.1 DUF72 domain-containing protein [Chloroflexota bacterium]MCI0646730.1 DUF72 domain-containing protein [Chloroflexota bacterium]MCI0731364.1 DUF72 domain-containing protein [Chloroflexota bacterium]
MVDWYLGTMGFSYKEDWSGVFYPEGLPQRDFLAYYSQFFNAVELDSTFYGTPRTEYVERWAAATPAEFKFCAKVPREITHDLRLANAADLMNTFVDTMRLLGDKLGAILVQLPPDFAFDQIHTLAVFLRHLPPDVRYAVEFRHPSWHATATGQLLQNHRACWVSTDYVHLPQRVYVTTDFIYIRWIGRHGQYEVKDHERVDMTPRLQAWYEDIQNRLDGINTIYGFFNNDYAGHSPATCNRFKAIVGLPTQELQPPQQGKLFE